MTDGFPAALVVEPTGPLHGQVRAPASKSLTNRALLVAAVATGTSRIRRPLESDDAAAMRGAATALGAVLERDGDDVVVHGVGGRLPAGEVTVDARLSGTTLRFVAAVAALAPGRVTVTGAAPLLRRPIGPLTRALHALGADVADRDGLPPVTVGGGLAGGEVTIDVSASSQFASAVLLAAPYARADVTVNLAGEAADAYIDMTVALLRRWGATVTPDGRRWTVTAGTGYTARDEEVEYDASAAAHLYALAVATGGSMTVPNVTARTLQPDAAITDVLRQMGAAVVADEGAVRVDGPARPLPVEVDLSALPDQVTTVAALAALADGTSRIHGVGVTRGHETDRLAALATELRKLGATVEEEPSALTITGPATRSGQTLDTYDDHRLAMAFAAIAGRVGATIRDPGCVAKTYPAFWDDARSVGLAATAAPEPP